MKQAISSICDDFKLAWHQGLPRRIEAVLEQSDVEMQSDLLDELLKLEISLRRLAGEQPTVADYAERFPQRLPLVQSALSDSTTTGVETIDVPRSQEGLTTIPYIAPPHHYSPTSRSDSPPSESRKLIGRYTIISTLGRGGQADVFRAVHPTLPIEVAIKLTHTRFSDRDREVLQEEAHILCDLDHPHIARIRDFDFDSGRPFMVLDFIRGRSLGQLAQSQPPSPEKTAKLVAKLARAIGYAHARGVLHRDLKPDNVIIDESGQPKIIDFGMSRMRSGISGGTSESDEVSGTLAYMAPEQAIGVASNTDHRVDVFALGAILYRLLVGKAPYPNKPLMELLQYVRKGDYDRASLDAAEVPEELKTICRRAMQPDPAVRFATAEQLAEALELGLVPRGVSPTKASSESLPSLTVAACLGALVVLLGGGWLITRPAHSVNKPDITTATTSTELTQGLNGSASVAESSNNLIKQFELVHIGNLADRAEFSGSLLQYRPPRVNDDIQVRAEFREPVYCFLVALNPDGIKQLCYPIDSKVAQHEPIKTLRYPADEGLSFGLTDGIGQQAFVLYTSREPLPAFNDWDSDLKKASWPDPEVAGNWLYHEGQLDAIGPMKINAADASRGAERKTKTPTLFKQMCDRMRQAAVTDVRGVLFEVQGNP